ncbi:hypothetical protein EDM59_27840 [Brevibacillus nitrificans]|uniref:Uncharacterized protein n=1 Tax=Brevibacillus nitrificans TaxID=651560 RepID=A0A3M8CW69_9BACL|nr:hypothetical protein EDM59_27840 [Brevibacillus nitrificans]
MKSFHSVPMHMVIAQLESGRTYLLKSVVTGGPNAGNANIVTYTAHSSINVPFGRHKGTL